MNHKDMGIAQIIKYIICKQIIIKQFILILPMPFYNNTRDRIYDFDYQRHSIYHYKHRYSYVNLVLCIKVYLVIFTYTTCLE